LAYFKPRLKLKLILVSDKEEVIRLKDEVDDLLITYWPGKEKDNDDKEEEVGEGDKTKLNFANIVSTVKQTVKKCKKLILDFQDTLVGI